MSPRAFAIRGVVILLIGVALLCTAGLAYGFALRRTAMKLVNDLSGLTIGQSTFYEIEQIANSYRSYRVPSWTGEPTKCGPEECFFMFDLSNLLLSKVRLVRPAVFRATVEVNNNKVTSIHIVFWGGVNGNHGVVIDEAERPSTFKTGAYLFPTPVGKPYLHVFLTPAASATEKQHTFALDVHCLASWRACDLGCDYLPFAWQDWRKELLATWMDERSFLVSYPKSARCP